MADTPWYLTVLADRPDLRRAAYEAVVALYDKRRIDTEVRARRFNNRYDAGDWEGVEHMDPLLASLPEDKELRNPRRTVKSWVEQRPGVVMRRWALPTQYDPGDWESTEGSFDDRVSGLIRGVLYPQLRPFKFKELDPIFDITQWRKDGAPAEDPGVYNGDVWHRHAAEYWHVHTARGVERVSTKEHPWPVRGASHHAHKKDQPYREQHLAASHADYPMEDGEEHPHKWPGSTEYPEPWGPHLHNEDVAVEHKGVGASRTKQHRHARYAKYVYIPGPRGDKETQRWRALYPDLKVPSAQTVDVHPLAWEALAQGGDTAYFVMEGLLKNDAVLSELRRQGQPPAVLNCGSVTLWNDPDLEQFARATLSKWRRVVLVTDSDVGNEAVERQARNLADRLRDWDVTPVVAFPPPTCYPETGRALCTCDAGQPHADHKNGVDDWVGSMGLLKDLLVYRHAALGRAVEVTVRRSDQGARDRAVLEWLVEHQGLNGLVRFTHRQVARALDLVKHHQRVSYALVSLRQDGHLSAPDVDEFTELGEDVYFHPGKYGSSPSVVRLAPQWRRTFKPVPLG